MKQVTIYTDGACSGNPGPGGWGVVLACGGLRRELSGGEASTTNNRMELTAVIEGLSALKYPCQVTLVSDSRYVLDAITKGWVYKWKANGWMRTKTEPALNSDLWERLLPLLEQHELRYEWIRGHTGHPETERCDQMAVAESRRFR